MAHEADDSGVREFRFYFREPMTEGKKVFVNFTADGAEILDLGDITGSIRPGKKADLVIASFDQPHLTPIYDVYSHITYSMRSSDIETVMINGKIIVENRNLLTGDEAEILAKAGEWQDKIKGE